MHNTLFFKTFLKRVGVPKVFKCKTPHLTGCPQKKAQCLRVTDVPPKKPNSAKRKVAKVLLLSNFKETYCYIPGIGHKLKAFSTVLIRGGRRVDIPGMKYTAIRGKYDFEPLYARKSSRSRYGVKKY